MLDALNFAAEIFGDFKSPQKLKVPQSSISQLKRYLSKLSQDYSFQEDDIVEVDIDKIKDGYDVSCTSGNQDRKEIGFNLVQFG